MTLKVPPSADRHTDVQKRIILAVLLPFVSYGKYFIYMPLLHKIHYHDFSEGNHINICVWIRIGENAADLGGSGSAKLL